MKHMVVNLVQILLHMPSHDILCAGSNEKKCIQCDTESERGAETEVVLTDTLFRDYLTTGVITCNKMQYTVTLKTVTTYRFVKLHLWKEFIPRLIL